uniref:Phospholipid scramblase n=1 Tax=Eptatretus burgeri TaxID=7764 RepID=A0A8C4N1L0_EPTBU
SLGTGHSSPPSPPPPETSRLNGPNGLLLHQSSLCVSFVEINMIFFPNLGLTVLFSFHMENKYEITNSVGQHIWTAKEKSGCCARLCLGNLLVLLIRPFRCTPGPCCWCKCCLQEMEVMGPGGMVLGFVRQQWHLCLPRFTIQTEDGKDALFVHGPFCICSCGSDVKFKILDVSGNSIGLICKRWGGCCQEWITAADNFTVQFPMDLDVKLKASLLAAALLLDYTYFENVDNGN